MRLTDLCASRSQRHRTLNTTNAEEPRRPSEIPAVIGGLQLAGTIVALAATGASTLPAAAAPAQSGYLSDVQIDMGTVKKYADESATII